MGSTARSCVREGLAIPACEVAHSVPVYALIFWISTLRWRRLLYLASRIALQYRCSSRSLATAPLSRYVLRQQKLRRASRPSFLALSHIDSMGRAAYYRLHHSMARCKRGRKKAKPAHGAA